MRTTFYIGVLFRDRGANDVAKELLVIKFRAGPIDSDWTLYVYNQEFWLGHEFARVCVWGREKRINTIIL